MARKLIYKLVRSLTFSQRRNSQAGFTLIELLVAMAIGSIVVGTLLYGTVELLQINSREDSRTETQRDMQAALDYISAELREAVFVYDGQCLSGTTCSGGKGLLEYLPSELKATGRTPVLAFWRADELPQTLIDQCRNNPTLINTTAYQGIPCLSRRSFSLVVYYLETTTDATWRGKSRIRRYELTQFASNGTANNGWADPAGTKDFFAGWPFDAQDGTDSRVGKTNATWQAGPVLVDFVDDPTAGTATVCPSNATASPVPAYVRTPTTSSNSFYACVRGGGLNNNPNNRNQEVALFIRGNAAGRGGVPTTARVTFEMGTQALTRSSYGKQ